MRTGLQAVGILLAIAWSASWVEAAVEESVAKHIPWSGYWWPVAKGELLGPLEKYDAISGGRAQWWELANKPPGPLVPLWHGYCHGWAAASVLEREPRMHRVANNRFGQGPVALSVGDQKGWYSASHAFDVANYFGDRYGDGEGSEDMQDMAPDMLWHLLQMFIKEHGVPMVMDLDASAQVWNYPVFAYRVEYYPSALGAGWYDGFLQLCAADDAVPLDFVGTMPYLQSYTFVFQMRDGAIVLGSGQWTGHSVMNHPDFAWYPYVAIPENPEIRYKTVKGLVDPDGPHVADSIDSVRRSNNAPNANNANSTNSEGRAGIASSMEGEGTVAASPRLDAWLGYRRDSADASERDSAGDPNRDNKVPLPVSPLQLVAAIADKTSAFGLDARLAEFGKVQFHVEEPYAIVGSSEEDGYLYVFHVAPDGELTLLHPAPRADNRVRAGATFRVPGLPTRHCTTTGPFGNHRIKVLVAKRPLSLTGLDRSAFSSRIDEPKTRTEEETERPPTNVDSTPWRGLGFRFFPSQYEQVRSLLTDYVHEKSLTGTLLGQIDTAHVLGKFAQDEITYYVGPK